MRRANRTAVLWCTLLTCACAARSAGVSYPPPPSTETLARVWDAEHVSPAHSPLVDHAEIERRLKSLPQDLFTVREAGRSIEGRSISHVKAGTGPTPVLLWSQMHGDEPTATSALFDVFEYLTRHRSEPVASRILQKLTLHVVPMLNPDGAERFTRRNAQGIDINRDALNLVTPEGRLLKQLRDELKPSVGFNLHNQSWRTAIGTPARPAVISLLSVAYDEARTVNAGRLLTKKLAAVVREAIEPIAGDRIGKYDDSFEVRAFGDNLTLWGTPVLLIETGPWPAENPDPHLVRLNFIAILSALDALATGRVHGADPDRYDSLPSNDSGLSYWVIRGGSVLRGDGLPAFKADLAVTAQRRVRVEQGRRELWLTTNIDDVGDLRNTAALFTIDATGLVIAPSIADVGAGAEIKLPDWTAANPASSIVQTGSPASFMLLRPLGEGRYRVERIFSGAWRIDAPASGPRLTTSGREREGAERGEGPPRATEPGGVQGSPPKRD